MISALSETMLNWGGLRGTGTEFALIRGVTGEEQGREAPEQGRKAAPRGARRESCEDNGISH